MSFGISSILTEVLARSAGVEVTSPLQIRAVGGGSINNAYLPGTAGSGSSEGQMSAICGNRAIFHTGPISALITTSRQQHWFCKINDAVRFPDLFVLERQGLTLLGATGMIRVPGVIACEVIAGKQVLVLEWIEEGLRSNDFWTTFGRQLAQLHQATSACFGLVSGSLPSGLPASAPVHNYMGALPQSNTPSLNWVEFFRDQRLQPQLKLAVDKGYLGAREIRQFQGLYKALDAIFEKEPPARATPVTFVRFQHCWTLARSYSRSVERELSLRQPGSSRAHRSGRLLWTQKHGPGHDYSFRRLRASLL